MNFANMATDHTHLSLLSQVPWPREDRQWPRQSMKSTMLRHETFATKVDSRSWFIKPRAGLLIPPPKKVLTRTKFAPWLWCVCVKPVARHFVVIPYDVAVWIPKIAPLSHGRISEFTSTSWNVWGFIYRVRNVFPRLHVVAVDDVDACMFRISFGRTK